MDVVLDPEDPNFHSDTHFQAIRNLELRLDRLTQESPLVLPAASPQQDASPNPRIEKVAELYRLAAYIYLERLARSLDRDSSKARDLFYKAVKIMDDLGGCERLWPLFVIALEARSDEERAVILDFMAASLKRRPLGNIHIVQRMIRSAWAQQGLQGDGEVNPLALYSLVISGNRVPPAFT